MNSVSFILVADGPRFEDSATILVGSMRLAHPEVACINVYCPEQKLLQLSGFFREAMAVLGASIVPIIDQPSPWASPYPHGNKLLAASQARDCDVSVFFDTDTVLLSPISDSVSKGGTPEPTVFAVPEGVPTWGRHIEDWVPVYRHFGLPVPDERVRMCRGRRVETLPYFNAGFVGFAEAATQMGLRFGELWLETAIEIDQALDIPNKRPWLDQIALPIAVARSGLKMRVHDETYNYSLYRRREPAGEDVRLAHYHIPGSFRSEPACLAVYRRVLDLLPDELSSVLRKRAIPYEMPGRAKNRV